MNDPHVEVLIYRIAHDDSVHYDDAAPAHFDEAEFRGTVDRGQARFEMKRHHATAETARQVVEPYIAAWQVSAGLLFGPNDFKLVYSNAEIVDRNPTPGVIEASATSSSISGGQATMIVGRGSYPAPPTGLRVSADVSSMYDRYAGYMRGQEPLDTMAYFCLTVMDLSAGDRKKAAQELAIDHAVLKKLGELTSDKGGAKPRKAGGLTNPQTDSERVWVNNTVKAIIRRAAEVAYDPDEKYETISMSDLPQL